MIVIVVDTTETFDDPNYAGPSWAKMHFLVSKGVAVVVVPQIVRDETRVHFRNQLEKAHKDLQRNAGRVSKLLRCGPEPLVHAIDIESGCSEHLANVEKRLKLLQISQPGYKDIDFLRVVERALAKRKPFAESGRGFKDAMLWEHVLNAAKAYSELVVFVTGNTNDFGADCQLAPELQDDLTSNGIPKDKVVLCSTIHEAFELYGKPHIDRLEAIRNQIEYGSYPKFNADDFYTEAYERILRDAEDWIGAWTFDELGHITRRLFESPRLSSMSVEPFEVEIGDVFRIDEDTLAIGVTYHVEAEIACSEIEYLGDDVPPFESEYVGGAKLRIENTVILEEATGQVESHEVESIQIEPGFKWPRDDTD
jgi:hypothetical protein